MRGSWDGGWPVERDGVGQSDSLHCLDGVVVLHSGSNAAVLVRQSIPNHFIAVEVFFQVNVQAPRFRLRRGAC
jgi:hypothetical protein